MELYRKIQLFKTEYRDDLLSNFETLYALYNKLAREAVSQKKEKKTISETEADKILDELLYPDMGLDAMYFKNAT